MSIEDLEGYEAELELQLEREYRDVYPMFRFVVETERRFYLCNEVKTEIEQQAGRTMLTLLLRDAWVWDLYRQNRFVPSVRVVTFKDVNIEELPRDDEAALQGTLDLGIGTRIDPTSGHPSSWPGGSTGGAGGASGGTGGGDQR